MENADGTAMAQLEDSLNSALVMLIQFSFTSQNADSQHSDERFFSCQRITVFSLSAAKLAATNLNST